MFKRIVLTLILIATAHNGDAMEVESKISQPLPGTLHFEITYALPEIQNHVGLMMKNLILQTFNYFDYHNNLFEFQYFRDLDENKLTENESPLRKEVEEENRTHNPISLNYRFKLFLAQEFQFEFFGRYWIDCCYDCEKPLETHEAEAFDTIHKWANVVEEWGCTPKLGYSIKLSDHEPDDLIKDICHRIFETTKSRSENLIFGSVYLEPKFGTPFNNVSGFLQDPFFKDTSVNLCPPPIWNNDDIRSMADIPTLTGLDLPYDVKNPYNHGYKFTCEDLKAVTQLKSIKFGLGYDESFNGCLEFMTNLQTLHLGYHHKNKDKNNDMNNNDLKTLVNLTYLNMRGNSKVTYEGISHLTNLTILDLGASWKDDDTGRIKRHMIEEMKERMPGLDIRVCQKKV